MEEKKKKEFKMPHAFAILAVVIALMCVATWIVPAGVYQRVEGPDGRMIVDPDSFTYIENTPVGLGGFLMAIPTALNQSVSIIMFTLLVGSAVAVVNQIGVLPRGIEVLANTFKDKGVWLLPILMFAIALCDALIGTSELTLLYVPLLLPLILKMGFDSMTAIGTIFVASAAGFTAALTNPFSIAIPQSIVGLPLYSGIGFRAVTFVCFFVVGCVYVMAYARKVKKDPQKGMTYQEDLEKKAAILAEAEGKVSQPLTVRQKLASVFSVAVLAYMIYGLLRLGWDMPQMSACCIVIAAGAGLISGFGVNKTCDAIVDGCKDMMLGGLLVGIATAVSVVMTEGQILDTIVHFLAGALQQLPSGVAIVGILLAVTLINFFIISASGKAVAVFPIISPLASLLGITQQSAVLAYQFGDGFTNYIWPTSGMMWGCLGMAGVSYKKWCKFYIPILLIFILMGIVFLLIAQAIQYGPF